MHIQNGASLADYSTMRLGGPAAHVAVVTSEAELIEALAWASERSLETLMIGGGSNIIWRDEGFSGLVLVNNIGGYNAREADGVVQLTVGAGENWDSVVDRSVQAGLTGIEALSLIPGSCGATPVQNVGAYGQEIADTLTSVRAYDRNAGEIVTINAADCGFGYRASRFKLADHGRFFITSLTLRLLPANPQPPFYPAVQQYLDQQSLAATPATVRQAVIAIRSAKLPDPAVVANNGSFFANPVVSQTQLAQIQAITDDAVPHWPTQEGLVKLSAAWLIEQAGFKDYHDAATGMATWKTQPLVLVNEQAQSTAALLAFKQMLVSTVQEKYGVPLVQEPELLP